MGGLFADDQDGCEIGMARFEARTSSEPGRVTVALAGECDLATRDALATALRAAVKTAPLVVVDMSDLEFLDSSGLHSIVGAHHEAQDRGGQLWVVNATGTVAHVLDLTGVGELLGPPIDGSGPSD